MNYLEILIEFCKWLFISSLKASIVVGIILILRFILRKHLPAKWQHALWLLLVLRLILPYEIPSSMSLYNWTDDIAYQSLPPQIIFSPNKSLNTSIPSQANVSNVTNEQHIQSITAENRTVVLTVPAILALIWFAVAVTFLLLILYRHIRQRNLLKVGKEVEDNRITRILESAKKQLHIKRRIHLYQLPEADTAFWYGLIKPRIYLPVDFIKNFSAEQLHYILLHELAHYRGCCRLGLNFINIICKFSTICICK